MRLSLLAALPLLALASLARADGSAGSQVIFNLDFKPTEDERLTLEARGTDRGTKDKDGMKSPRVIVFFNAPADPQRPTHVTLVNGLASVVPATPERLRLVREALGVKDGGK